MALCVAFGDELTHRSPGSATRNTKDFRKEVYPGSCRSALGQVSDEFDVCSSSDDHGTILHLNTIEMQLCAKSFGRRPSRTTGPPTPRPAGRGGSGVGTTAHETRRLNAAQVQELIYDKGQATFEATPVDADADDIDQPLLESYAEAVRHPDARRLLQARGAGPVRRQAHGRGCPLVRSAPPESLP